MSIIELLEPRIAPAVFATFPDVDGDLVTVNISKGTPPGPDGPGDAVIVLSPQGPFGGLGACQLLRINLLGNQVFEGANITVTAVPQDVNGDGTLDGDGLVNIGFIDASGGGGIDLGAVLIEGDLGRIVAGDADLTTPGLKSLNVRSLGLLGTNTGAASLTLDITGKLGSLKVKTDVAGMTLLADGMGDVTIGGSVRLSRLNAGGPLGFLKVGGDWIGGDSTGVGDLNATSLAGLNLGGSWIAGRSGGNLRIGDAVALTGDAGPMKFGKDIIGSGSVGSGGSIFPSGQISIIGKLASLTVGGSVDTNGFEGSARIQAFQGSGPVKVGGDLNGSNFQVSGKLASLTVGGSVEMLVSSTGDIGPVKIRGSLQGNPGTFSGTIKSDAGIASVTIGGSIVGSLGAGSGQILAGGKIGPVVVGGDVRGGSGDQSGYIHTTNGAPIASVTIGGSLRGEFSATFHTGEIFSEGSIGPVKIGGDMIGGGRNSGLIDGGSIASVRVGGSVIGAVADFSGTIVSDGVLGSVRILGDLIGGRIDGNSVKYTGYIEGGRIMSIFIGGSIISGVDNAVAGITLEGSGSIRAKNDIGSLTVKGSLIGNRTIDESNVVISAYGQARLPLGDKTDLAIGKIIIGGSMTQAKILAGYDELLVPKNADAQIGSITIGRDLVSSSILAGVTAGNNGVIGDSDDVKISGAGVKDDADSSGAVSKIAKLIVKGSTAGTAAPNDTALFGIVTQQLGKFRLGGGAMLAFTAGASNDLFNSFDPLNPARAIAPTQGSALGSETFDFHAFEVV